MACRIDSDAAPTAHAVIQAMIVRAHEMANRSGKTVGLFYDLATDRIGMVDLGASGLERSALFRIVTPRPGIAGARAGHPWSAEALH
jgi:hypothetical protein